MRLTERGQRLVSLLAVLGFLIILGIAGWIEGLGA
jgi:hypothetical protein